MFRKQFGLCLLVIIGLLHLGAVAAATLNSNPRNQIFPLGGSVNVDLRISDLGNDILTGFDLDIRIDAPILDFHSFVFGVGLDVFGSGSIQLVDDPVSNLVNLFDPALDFEFASKLNMQVETGSVSVSVIPVPAAI